MKKQFVKISSEFGLDIMALNFALFFDLPVVILPPQTNQEEFDQESEKILSNMSFFYNRIQKVPFGEKEKFEAEAWAIGTEIKNGTFDDNLWGEFANSKLHPQKLIEDFEELANGPMNTMLIPPQFISNGETVHPALSSEVFDFLKNCPQRLILGQHFHKESDLPQVEKLAQDFNLYVPGLTENEQILGMQGVKYLELYDLYYWIDAAVGITGTHTWLLLALFPDTAQIILYDKSGTENWKAIEAAYQAAGYCINCIGFDAKTNTKELSAEIEEIYKTFFP